MKVIGIISSPRKNGSTAQLVESVLTGAARSGAETESIYLTDCKIEFCQGCLKCMSTGRCFIRDDFDSIKEKVNNADGIVLGSPTYMNTYNAEMKRLFERFGLYEHMTSECFGGKYFVGVSAGGGTTGNTTANLTSAKGLFEREYISGTIGLAVKRSHSKDHPEIITQCEELGKKLCQDIECHNPYIFQNIKRRLFNKYILQPNFKKIITRNKNTTQKAVYDFLVKHGKIK